MRTSLVSIVVSVVTCLLSSRAFAQAAPPSPVQQFDSADVDKVPPSAASARAPLTMDEVAVTSGNSRVTLNLFGDTAFQILSSDSKKPAFVLGPLDLLLVGQYASLVALSEIALEPQASGEVGIDVERFSVGWRTERFSLDAGRTHTELGYWNNAFHHGRWLELTVDRPRAVRFEDDGGILPIHSVGVTGKWRPLMGERQIELVGAIANGRGDIVDNIHVTDDTNGWKSLLLKIEGRGFLARDLRLGLSGLYDRIAPASAMVRPAFPDQSINEAIGNAYLAYRGPDLTVIAEAFDDFHWAGAEHWKVLDAFLLAGYRWRQLIPYAMGEVRGGGALLDPFFVPDAAKPPEVMGRFVEVTGGLRWEVNSWSAIKLEYRLTVVHDAGVQRIQRGIVDWTFGL
jgi:hypothetical protein